MHLVYHGYCWCIGHYKEWTEEDTQLIPISFLSRVNVVEASRRSGHSGGICNLTLVFFAQLRKYILVQASFYPNASISLWIPSSPLSAYHVVCWHLEYAHLSVYRRSKLLGVSCPQCVGAIYNCQSGYSGCQTTFTLLISKRPNGLIGSDT